jgi:hypothetical protein
MENFEFTKEEWVYAWVEIIRDLVETRPDSKIFQYQTVEHGRDIANELRDQLKTTHHVDFSKNVITIEPKNTNLNEINDVLSE